MVKPVHERVPFVELRDQVDAHLKALRKADSQAAAVAWMTQAYKLFERCLVEIDRPEPQPRLIFMPPQIIEVVREIPKAMRPEKKADPHFIEPRYKENWWNAKTVVYPDVPMPPPKPRPWTHRDTVRLEAAARNVNPALRKRGK